MAPGASKALQTTELPKIQSHSSKCNRKKKKKKITVLNVPQLPSGVWRSSHVPLPRRRVLGAGRRCSMAHQGAAGGAAGDSGDGFGKRHFLGNEHACGLPTNSSRRVSLAASGAPSAALRTLKVGRRARPSCWVPAAASAGGSRDVGARDGGNFSSPLLYRNRQCQCRTADAWGHKSQDLPVLLATRSATHCRAGLPST